MNMSGKFQKQILTSMFWRFGERFFAQAVTFIVSVVLARLLTPEDYGNVAILMIFIDLADVFVVHGFGSALVQKKDADNMDFSSVLYFSIVLTVIIYTVAYVCAPILGTIFESEQLPVLFRVLALRIPLSGINSVQHAYVQRNMLFRRFFFSTIGGTMISAVIGIALAYSGLGAWALIAQYLCNSLCDTVILWLTVKWRPERIFSWKRLAGLLGFGWKMLGSQLIHVLYNRLSSFVIGTTYSTADLAYYEQGAKIPGILETNIDTTINSVLFPAMSKAQDNRNQLKNMVRKSIRSCSLIVCPIMVGLAVLANNVVELVYSEKWLPCVIFMQIACVRMMLEPIQTANLQAIKALGRSDLYIKMEFLKKAYGIIVLLIATRMGILAIAYGALTQSFFSFIVNSIPNRKVLEYRYIEQFGDIIPAILLSAFMGGIVYVCGIWLSSEGYWFFIQVLIGVIVYIAEIYMFCRKDFVYMLGLFKTVLKK